MTHPIDRKIITTEAVRRILRDAGAPPIVIKSEDHPDPHDVLREDLESIRSLYFTGLELRAPQCRQEVARTLAAATGLRFLISLEIVGKKPTARFFQALDIRHQGFLRHLNSFIAELESDSSPTLIRQLDVFHRGAGKGVSAFENVIRMLADRWRHYFDEEPGYNTTVDRRSGVDFLPGGAVYGPFIHFAERALIEMEILDDGRPYARSSIARALRKVRG
jgi:hypothetical protein